MYVIFEQEATGQVLKCTRTDNTKTWEQMVHKIFIEENDDSQFGSTTK